jgi:nanoRNase/pAp phosphatase (c-di-AMP/oligoRNAs hydrolase)
MTTTLFPYEEVKAKIQSAEYITILSHLNPDADRYLYFAKKR